MKKLYLFFLLVGLIGIVFVYLFGMKGAYILNLGFLGYIFRRKPDEREIQLMRRVFVSSFGLGMVILINIYILSSFVQFSDFLKANWVGFFISLFFMILGITGIVIFSKE